MSDHDHQLTTDYDDDEVTYCEVHPTRETALRCNKCDRYMCAECVVQTPVGYRCKQCTRQHEDAFFKGNTNNDLRAFGATLILSALVTGIISAIGFGLFIAIILGFPIGGAISEASIRALDHKRTRNSGNIATAGAVLGGLLGGVIYWFLKYDSVYDDFVQISGSRRIADQIMGSQINWVIDQMFNDLGLLIIIGIIAFTVYSRLRV